MMSMNGPAFDQLVKAYLPALTNDMDDRYTPNYILFDLYAWRLLKSSALVRPVVVHSINA